MLPPPIPAAQHTSQKPVGEPEEAQRTARKHWCYWAASTWEENKRAGSCWLSREMASEKQVCRFARKQPLQRMSCTSSPDIPKHLASCSWADAVQLWGARSVRTLLLIFLAPNLALEVVVRKGYFPSPVLWFSHLTLTEFISVPGYVFLPLYYVPILGEENPFDTSAVVVFEQVMLRLLILFSTVDKRLSNSL